MHNAYISSKCSSHQASLQKQLSATKGDRLTCKRSSLYMGCKTCMSQCSPHAAVKCPAGCQMLQTLACLEQLTTGRESDSLGLRKGLRQLHATQLPKHAPHQHAVQQGSTSLDGIRKARWSAVEPCRIQEPPHKMTHNAPPHSPQQ